jgi:P-type Cu+ transporter
MQSNIVSGQHIKCFHCGDDCPDDSINVNEKYFCCEGCKLVFQILDENNLCEYYDLNNTPGISKINVPENKYKYLDDENIIDKLLTFSDGKTASVTFNLPKIHCSSCIWLLEHLYQVDDGIMQSRVNFLKREVSINFLVNKTSVRKIAEMLGRIGYPPEINLGDIELASRVVSNKSSYYKLGISFFCFGNIMLLSLPEYFGLTIVSQYEFHNLFRALNILLALPVLLYADSDFLKSAWLGLRQKTLNIDVPISLGILTMFTRSVYEIISGTGPGYMDSFTGLVFFLLLGRQFQNNTYNRLSFDRDYKSYFPIAVSVIKQGKEQSKTVSKLEPHDRMVIRNGELIPADSLLIKGQGNIDYSFVTGENLLVSKGLGEKIYAGGIQSGTPIELEVIKKVSQSRLTQLWNENNFSDTADKNISELVNRVSRWFTFAVLVIAAAAGTYHLTTGTVGSSLNIITSILIITCPCALALSYPFTLGNSMRILSKLNFYVKNTVTIENISKINHIIFDKTGTITHGGKSKINFNGKLLSDDERSMILTLVSASSHPLSRLIAQELGNHNKLEINNFTEIPGKGIQATINGKPVMAGSAIFTGYSALSQNNTTTAVYVNIDNKQPGYFEIKGKYRDGFFEICHTLKNDYRLELLSGDNDAERTALKPHFETQQYDQSPDDKLKRVKELQDSGNRVLMIGDGLNDAGALKQSNVGIAVSNNANAFSPASDVIMDGGSFTKLPSILKFSKWSLNVVYISYLFSIAYNVTGLYFAVQGMLTPLTAAILMPLSSTSVIVLSTAGSSWAGKTIFKK